MRNAPNGDIWQAKTVKRKKAIPFDRSKRKKLSLKAEVDKGWEYFWKSRGKTLPRR